ncbi:MAG: YceI family protein [candidate division Zixibacteria bacterium]
MKKMMLLPVLFLMAVTAVAQDSKTFYVNDEKGRDVVTFTSKAPLETIVGKTSRARGFIEVDINNINSAINGKFEVDLASVKTGIDMRDGHMRDNYLETEQYPKAVFELSRVVESSATVLEDQKPIELKVEGNFTVHGVTKPMIIHLTVTYFAESESTRPRLPGDLLHIEGTFDIFLTDHNIEIPKFVILKLDDKQVINIDLFSSTGLAPTETAK